MTSLYCGRGHCTACTLLVTVLPIIFDMFINQFHLTQASQNLCVVESLPVRSPIDVRFLVANIRVEHDHDQYGDQCRPPVNDEHYR